MISLAFSLAVTSFLMSGIALFVVLWTTLKKFDDRPSAKNVLSFPMSGSNRAARDLNRDLVPPFMDDGMPNVFDPEEEEY